MRVDARGDAEQNGLRFSLFARDAVDRRQLSRVIRHKMADAALDREQDIGIRLVVAVKIRFFERKSRLERRVKLSRGNQIDPDLFLRGNRVNPLEAERLTRHQRVRALPEIALHRAFIEPAAGADPLLVQQIERCAVFLRHIYGGNARKRQFPPLVYRKIIVQHRSHLTEDRSAGGRPLRSLRGLRTTSGGNTLPPLCRNPRRASPPPARWRAGSRKIPTIPCRPDI